MKRAWDWIVAPRWSLLSVFGIVLYAEVRNNIDQYDSTSWRIGLLVLGIFAFACGTSTRRASK